MSISVVVGNPKRDSRTLAAACHVAQRLTGEPADVVVDLATFGEKLLAWGDTDVKAAVGKVAASDLLVCASPTFKATYTGLLKLFLDQFSPDQLSTTTAFPMMLGAGPHHAMAPEYLLKPVLVELGAACPVRGLYLLDSEWEHSDHLDAWITTAAKHVKQGTQR